MKNVWVLISGFVILMVECSIGSARNENKLEFEILFPKNTVELTEEIVSISSRYEVPIGFERVEVDSRSFGAFLRDFTIETSKCQSKIL
jgi:hypothetical protein